MAAIMDYTQYERNAILNNMLSSWINNNFNTFVSSNQAIKSAIALDVAYINAMSNKMILDSNKKYELNIKDLIINSGDGKVNFFIYDSENKKYLNSKSFTSGSHSINFVVPETKEYRLYINNNNKPIDFSIANIEIGESIEGKTIVDSVKSNVINNKWKYIGLLAGLALVGFVVYKKFFAKKK
jgi:hypothetical protein